MLLLAQLAVLLCLGLSNGLVQEYDQAPIPGSSLEWLLLGLYNGTNPTLGKARIDINVTFTREDFATASHVEAMVFHEEDLAYVGIHTPYKVLLCCDNEVYTHNACEKEQLGYTALTTAVARRSDIFYRLVWFDALQTSAQLVHSYEITRPGLYYVIFVNCHEREADPFTMTGQLLWLNQPGHLAGSQAHLILSYTVLGCCYALLLSLWLAVLFWWRPQHVILLHHALSLLFFLGAAAAFTRASALGALNQTGSACYPCSAIWALLATLSSLSFRLLALLIAMGLSIICPWYEVERRQLWGIVLLSGAYLLAAGGQNFLLALSSVLDSSGRQPVLLMLPVNLANTAFLISIFVELIRTIHFTRDEGERDKFKLYVIHLLMLFGVAAAALLFYVLQLLVQWRDVSDLTWHFDWLFEAAWEQGMFFIALIWAVMWFPRPLIKSFVFYEREPLDWRPPRLID